MTETAAHTTGRYSWQWGAMRIAAGFGACLVTKLLGASGYFGAAKAWCTPTHEAHHADGFGAKCAALASEGSYLSELLVAICTHNDLLVNAHPSMCGHF